MYYLFKRRQLKVVEDDWKIGHGDEEWDSEERVDTSENVLERYLLPAVDESATAYQVDNEGPMPEDKLAELRLAAHRLSEVGGELELPGGTVLQVTPEWEPPLAA